MLVYLPYFLTAITSPSHPLTPLASSHRIASPPHFAPSHSRSFVASRLSFFEYYKLDEVASPCIYHPYAKDWGLPIQVCDDGPGTLISFRLGASAYFPNQPKLATRVFITTEYV